MWTSRWPLFIIWAPVLWVRVLAREKIEAGINARSLLSVTGETTGAEPTTKPGQVKRSPGDADEPNTGPAQPTCVTYISCASAALSEELMTQSYVTTRFCSKPFGGVMVPGFETPLLHLFATLFLTYFTQNTWHEFTYKYENTRVSPNEAKPHTSFGISKYKNIFRTPFFFDTRTPVRLGFVFIILQSNRQKILKPTRVWGYWLVWPVI